MGRISGRLLVAEEPSMNDYFGSDETDINANVVLVLAALSCALVAALGLNYIIHVLLRRERESMESVKASSGLEKHALKKIPVAVFRLRRGGLATECSICLGDFADGEKVRVLPECKHEFHVKCVDKWLAEHTSCPNCRCSLVTPKAVDGADQATVRIDQDGA